MIIRRNGRKAPDASLYCAAPARRTSLGRQPAASQMGEKVRGKDEAMRVSEGRTASAIAVLAGWGRRFYGREGVLAFGQARLVVLGLAAMVASGPLAIGAHSTAAAAPSDPAKVAFLSIQFLNDHADLEPTTSAERARLASTESAFKAQLEASGRYKFVSIPAEVAAKIAVGPEIGGCGGCEFSYGAKLGADYAAWIVVQKVSDLILNMNVYMVGVPAKKIAFVRSVDIRGNTDESWARGMAYLVKNYLLGGQ